MQLDWFIGRPKPSIYSLFFCLAFGLSLQLLLFLVMCIGAFPCFIANIV